MTSHHPRPQRPAATDYFNPAEQLELLQNIKAKAEKSATATPQEHHVVPADKSQSTAHLTAGVKPIDLVAHEVSLREKLEKAKADREAKAKAAAASAQGNTVSTPQSTNISQSPAVNGSKSTESPAGPPQPPLLNNGTTTNPIPIPTPPTYGPAWLQSIGYPQQTPPMSFPRPPPFPQYPPNTYGASQFGMTPFANGQSMFPQWGQFATTPTPGIPPAPQQQNQGGPPTVQSPPNNLGFGNQGPAGQSQSPPNQNSMGSMSPAQTGFSVRDVVLNL